WSSRMTVQDHLRQARHNEDLAQKLGNKPLEAYDWAITVLFYCILHFVDAYLLERYQIIPKGHTARLDRKTGQMTQGRNDYVRLHLPGIYGAYTRLYNASMKARYEGAYLALGSVGYYQKLRDNEFASARGFFRQLGW
ncbi:MAG: hypothetical protein HYZ72_01455, partial [Deltaproteobacteria bacterium]|nr:hypothetical protein [Deltaproteobacteria bacterium]